MDRVLDQFILLKYNDIVIRFKNSYLIYIYTETTMDENYMLPWHCFKRHKEKEVLMNGSSSIGGFAGSWGSITSPIVF